MITDYKIKMRKQSLVTAKETRAGVIVADTNYSASNNFRKTNAISYYFYNNLINNN